MINDNSTDKEDPPDERFVPVVSTIGMVEDVHSGMMTLRMSQSGDEPYFECDVGADHIAGVEIKAGDIFSIVILREREGD